MFFPAIIVDVDTLDLDIFKDFIFSFNILSCCLLLSITLILVTLIFIILKRLSRFIYIRGVLTEVEYDSDIDSDELIAKIRFQIDVIKTREYTGNIYGQQWRDFNAHLTSKEKFRIYNAAQNADNLGVLRSQYGWTIHKTRIHSVSQYGMMAGSPITASEKLVTLIHTHSYADYGTT